MEGGVSDVARRERAPRRSILVLVHEQDDDFVTLFCYGHCRLQLGVRVPTG
jgi:hypothetical protein